MKYQKNYLINVIFQLLFPPILELEKSNPAAFQNEIKEQFPTLKEAEEVHLEAHLSSDKESEVKVQRTRKRWMFFDPDKAKSVTVASNLFSLEYTKYQNATAMKADFEACWPKFSNIYPVRILERVGLRFIDQITLPSGDPLDWDGFIGTNLLAAVRAISSPDGHHLARSMHAVYWVAKDHRVTFQFGILNRDFPNPVARREFILDCDCSSIGPTDASDLSGCLDRYNDLCEMMFENSIGEELRKDMGILADTRQNR